MCKICGTEENIVHSGVDALLLGIDGAETGTMCYGCANKAREEKASNSPEMPERT